MNKIFLKISYALIAMTMLSVFTACDGGEGPDTTNPGDFELRGELTTTKTLEAGSTYNLIGGYQVKGGGNLIIEEGVTINATRTIDGQPDYIIVEQGGKITAIGTKERPIVMTSTRQQAGAWGGVHICGRAPINLAGRTGLSEIGDAPFGGNIVDDNSGIMRYVRLEYTGFAFSETKESNGLTLYGVGNGTTLEYLQTYKGADDGFEWFGGTVNAKYLVSTHSEDDSFDWTDGWVGKGQFWVAIQDQTPPDTSGTANGDCLIEADNREDNFSNTPQSHPILANITLIGNNDTNAQQRGIRLRAGTAVELYNVLITGKPRSVTVATDVTEASFQNGTSVIEHLWASSAFVYESISDLDLASKEGNAINQTISFTNGYIGTVDGGKDLSADPFFTRATYKGAVSADNDWTAEWTRK